MQSINATDSPETRVSFRLSAPDLDPEEITRGLGLTPDHVHRKGDHPRGNLKYAAYEYSMWTLDSRVSLEEPLEAHLDMLLSMLEPKSLYLGTLIKDIEADFYATIFNKNGFQLSPRTISRIANLGAGLGVTVYPGNDEGAESI